MIENHMVIGDYYPPGYFDGPDEEEPLPVPCAARGCKEYVELDGDEARNSDGEIVCWLHEEEGK